MSTLPVMPLKELYHALEVDVTRHTSMWGNVATMYKGYMDGVVPRKSLIDYVVAIFGKNHILHLAKAWRANPMESAQSKDESRKRKRVTDDAMTTTIEELVCPITQCVPLDPVTAEDGRIYDRNAIRTWLARRRTSPHTNLDMGPRVFPAPHVKNIARTLATLVGDDDERMRDWVELRCATTPLHLLRIYGNKMDMALNVHKFMMLATEDRRSAFMALHEIALQRFTERVPCQNCLSCRRARGGTGSSRCPHMVLWRPEWLIHGEAHLST